MKNWFKINDEDLEIIKPYKWVKGIRYPIAHIYKNGKRTSLYMHKLLMGEIGEMDHINGDGFDNRRANLRKATRQQNSFNQKINRSNNTSGYRGVTWKTPHGKEGWWYAGIEINGKSIHLGCYKDKIEAAKIYNQAAIKYFGEYARLNQL